MFIFKNVCLYVNIIFVFYYFLEDNLIERDNGFLLDEMEG